jgi:multidrug efflux system membrane fusion protein
MGLIGNRRKLASRLLQYRATEIQILMSEPQPPAAPDSPRRSRFKWWWLVLPVLLAAVIYLYSFESKSSASGSNGAPKGGGSAKKGGKGGRGGEPQAIPVVGTRALKGDISVYLNGLGNVTPLNTVTVKSRVDGQLMAVHFREGDTVKKGDLLMEIDPRPFQVQLTQAEGQLAKDQATLENARIDLTRYEKLLTQNAIPEQQVATQRSTVKQAEATVKSDEGQVDAAKLNLIYARITSPITGRVGLRLVDPGNIVHANDANGLVVLTQMEPTSVLFTISEDQLPVVLQKLRAGQRLTVEAYDREMKNKIATGTLTTVDNEIDQTTGTVRLRATFENRNDVLFPSQFVNARLLVERKHGVVLLPSTAIQRTSNTTFVYLVKPDSTVTVRSITTGTSEGDNTEITSGLAPGDVVVMMGVDKLEEGSKVRVQIQGEPENNGGGPGRGGRK